MRDDDLAPIPPKLIQAFEEAILICKDWPHCRAQPVVDGQSISIGSLAEWVQHYKGELRPHAVLSLLKMVERERELHHEARALAVEPSYKNGGKALQKLIEVKEREAGRPAR